MPWVLGIDEAGYGPNLGPLLQAMVAIQLPDDDAAGWDTLKSLVRHSHERTDVGLLIDDSKKVYTRGGLEALELGVIAALGLLGPTVGDIVYHTTHAGIQEELSGEAWYDPAELAPLAVDHQVLAAAQMAFAEGLPAGVCFGTPAALIVPAPRFNRICDEFGSKAVVLSQGLVELIPAAIARLPNDGEDVRILCDKQGGRNYYAALVQQAFIDGWVVIEKESAEESRYRVAHLERSITITFRPRADAESVSVALASMLCKYLREVCMRQFNRYWAKHIPTIKPTAGYPLDARRFYDEIRDAMAKLGLKEDQVWRKR